MEDSCSRKKPAGFLTILAVAALVVVYVAIDPQAFFAALEPDATTPGTAASQAEKQGVDGAKSADDSGAASGESRERYIASCDEIGGRNAPIFYKEFLKNPNKFKGSRVMLTGRIVQIEEDNGQTELQISIDDDADAIIVSYPGTVDAYQDDTVTVYGEGGGLVERENRLGADMTWATIDAKYVRKRRTSE